MLTQERLKQVLHYDPISGIFRHASPRKRVRVGEIAGRADRRGYVHMTIDRKSYLAHRLAWLYMTGRFPDVEVDHENHCRSDNRFKNLTEKTTADNNKNLSIGRRNSSGHLGVHFSNRLSRWVAKIFTDGKERYLGSFQTKEEAVSVRKVAERSLGFHKNHGVAIDAHL